MTSATMQNMPAHDSAPSPTSRSASIKASATEPTADEYNLDAIEEGEDGDVSTGFLKGHTRSDQRDMDRMGKRQELIRMFRPLSAMSFALILQATWEFMLISHRQGLTDGGRAGLFWSYVWTFIGFGFVIFSLAEMASMAPISGGQYHWVSEFASPGVQKPLSYITGWLSVLAWQAGAASGSFLTGTIIQGLISLNYPHYETTRWRGTLLVFAMVALIYVFNIWFARGMPAIQNALLILHIFGFLAVIIVLWSMSPRNPPSAVFTDFENLGGWPSMGLALMIGQISAVYGSLSSDATAHMAEEVKNAAINVPRAIAWGYVINGFLALIFMVTYLFALPSVNDALHDPSEFPFIYVFKQAVSIQGVNGLTSIVLVLVIASNISFNASASRQTFSFARDHGLPFARWLSTVHPKRHIPANAILLSCMISALLALINIGSTTAFEAIVSLNIAALMSTYMVSISCVLYRRIYEPHLLPPARWSFSRRSGLLVNGIGLAYAIFVFFWSFWPVERVVHAKTFNWTVVIFSAVTVIASFMYLVQGRKVYTGPVTSVVGRTGGSSQRGD